MQCTVRILPESGAISVFLNAFPSLQPKSCFLFYMSAVEERNGKIFEVSISKTSVRDKVRASKCRNGSVIDIV